MALSSRREQQSNGLPSNNSAGPWSKFLLTPVLMEGDTGSFDFAGRTAGRDSACFAQDDKLLEADLVRNEHRWYRAAIRGTYYAAAVFTLLAACSIRAATALGCDT